MKTTISWCYVWCSVPPSNSQNQQGTSSRLRHVHNQDFKKYERWWYIWFSQICLLDLISYVHNIHCKILSFVFTTKTIRYCSLCSQPKLQCLNDIVLYVHNQDYMILYIMFTTKTTMYKVWYVMFKPRTISYHNLCTIFLCKFCTKYRTCSQSRL
jgi:hypothetical protein